VNHLLSENVPLRSSSVLGDFAEDFPLAHRYGDLTKASFKLGRLTSTKFFAADHPMDITEALVNKAKTLAFTAYLESDDEGHTWTVVEFATAVPDGAEAWARGRGKRNPKTGQLLQNPAEIMEDVLRICGRTETFGQLRAEAAAAGIVLAGSVDTVKSIRATLDDIAFSGGAVWTPFSGRLYPTNVILGPVTPVTKMSAGDLKVSSDLQDTADILRLSYDVEEASGKPQHYIELTASPKLYGGIVQEVTLPWLRTPPNAETIGRRRLNRLAGDRRAVSYNSNLTKLRPGDWTKLTAHPAWPAPGADPSVMVLAIDVTPDTNAVQITGEAVLSSPVIEVTSHSVAVPPDLGAGIEVDYKNGVAHLRVLDEEDKPIKNASIAVDNGPPKLTDETGRVAFVLPKGEHLIQFAAEGYDSFVMSILL
jgi:hypothetical protein